MNDSPSDPYEVLRPYLEAVQPYLAAIQQAYDQLVDLGTAPATGPISSTNAAISAPRVNLPRPTPPAVDFRVNGLGGDDQSPASAPGAPPLGSAPPSGFDPVRSLSPRTSWALMGLPTPAKTSPERGVHATSDAPEKTSPVWTSNPFRNTMWPSRLPYRAEISPQNATGNQGQPSGVTMYGIGAPANDAPMGVLNPTSQWHRRAT